jgi:excisionase family DNA binding protein
MEFKVAEGAAEKGRKKVNTQVERLVGVEEFAGRLSVCRRQIYRLWHRGEIPGPVKVGGATRWPESDLEAYIEKLKQARRTEGGGEP